MKRLRGCQRDGTTLVEAAIVLGVFLTLVLGMLDLGIGVFRSHIISGAARQGARQALVHGALAQNKLGSWGPATLGPVAGDDPSNPLAQALRPYLTGLAPQDVTILAEWPDGGNERDMRVRVTVSTPYRSLFNYMLEGGVTLSATSTMPITH